MRLAKQRSIMGDIDDLSRSTSVITVDLAFIGTLISEFSRRGAGDDDQDDASEKEREAAEDQGEGELFADGRLLEGHEDGPDDTDG